MREVFSWSLNLGRYAGVQVRLHVFFLLLAAYVLHVGTLDRDDPLGPAGEDGLLWYGLAALGVLLASVVVHELGHLLAARRLGGGMDQMLLWPFGGLTLASVPPDPRSELSVSLAGPAANVLVCAASAAVLLAVDRQAEIVSLLNPLAPPYQVVDRGDGFPWQAGLRLVFWTNALLVTVNLLPAFPLDGARAVRAVLWRTLGYRWAGFFVARGAQVAAVALWVAAWLVHASHPFATMPLAILGTLLFFAARRHPEPAEETEPDDSLFGYDFSQGYTSLERREEPPRPPSGLLRRWLDARRRLRRQRLRQQERDDDRRVDAVLARLHELGLAGLSAEERALLDRVSARYRNRERS